MGMGMGFAMANQMGQSMGNQQGATPPPLPQSAKYYMALEDKQAGPFDVSVLKQYIQSGRLNPQTLVWREGMKAWTPAGQVSDINILFNTAPPPLPS